MHTQPCCILSHLDSPRKRFPLAGFCEHGVCCSSHSEKECKQESAVPEKVAIDKVYDTRDAKTALEDINKEIEEDLEEGQQPHQTDGRIKVEPEQLPIWQHHTERLVEPERAGR